MLFVRIEDSTLFEQLRGCVDVEGVVDFHRVKGLLEVFFGINLQDGPAALGFVLGIHQIPSKSVSFAGKAAISRPLAYANHQKGFLGVKYPPISYHVVF